MSLSTDLDRPTWSLRVAAQPGIQAVKSYWAPFLLIQGLAACLVLAYYRFPAAQAATESLQQLKQGGGLAFSFISGAIAGGVLPQAAKLVTGKARLDRAYLKDTLFIAFVYSIVGVQVDLFYHLQGVLFGNGIDLRTLLSKNVLDMAVASPVVFIPTAIVLFEWRKASFSAPRLIGAFGWEFYVAKVVPTLIPCWAFWIPMLFAVYAMPPNLQFPLAQLLEAAWCLLFVFMATREDA